MKEIAAGGNPPAPREILEAAAILQIVHPGWHAPKEHGRQAGEARRQLSPRESTCLARVG